MKQEYGLSVLVAILVAVTLDGFAAGPDPDNVGEVSVAREVYRDVSRPLRDMIADLGPRSPSEGDETAIPNIILDLDNLKARPHGPSVPAQRTPTGNPMPPVDISVNGMNLNFGGGGVPPDTTGDVGPNYFFQWVNTSIALYDKTTGAIDAATNPPVDGNVFWSGFGGLCQTTNNGDPLVLWDDQAHRWVVSQFAFNSISVPPWFQCVAVSTSEDPLGSYNRYVFEYSAFGFNDYGKMAVWTTVDGAQDAYLFTMHEFTDPNTFGGTSFAAVERDKMLNGESAQFIRYRVNRDDTYGALPFHVEGDFPLTAGTCPLFVHFSYGAYAYRFWKICLNWEAGTATFDPNPNLVPSEPFTIGLSGIPQLDAPERRLDDFGGNTMYRAVIRGFGPTGPGEAQAVITHAVNVGGDQAGERWVHFGIPMGQDGMGERFFLNSFERFVALPAPTIRIIDQGTYAPDQHSRWMGSINMDQSGNIAVGYSVSSLEINPEIRIAGRLRSDSPGVLRDEAQCSPEGTGAQTGLFPDRPRWGDYATMAVDPENQCTFWFTNEYYATTSVGTWNTRICSLEFDTCGDPDFILETIPNSRAPVCGDDLTVQVRAGEFGALGENVSLSQGSVPGGVSLNFDSASIAAGDSTDVTLTGSAALADGLYTAGVDGSAAGLNRSTDILFGVSATRPGQPVNSIPGADATGIVTRPYYEWANASGAVEYLIEVALDEGFTQLVESTIVDDNAHTSGVLLDPLTTYYWRVRPKNFCGSGITSEPTSFTTGVPGVCPAGTTPVEVFSDDVQDDSVAWTVDNAIGGADTLWNKEIPPAGTGLVTRAWWAEDTTVETDQRLISPSIALPVGQNPIFLSWDTHHQYETAGDLDCWDGGFIEININGGGWAPLGNDYNLADPYLGRLQSNNPAGTQFAWCHQPAGGNSVQTIFLLSEFEGDDVQIRFRSTADGAATGPDPAGWGVDNVLIQSCAE